MGITLRFNGPPSPGWAEDGTTWVDDLGSEVGLPRLTGGPLQRRVMSGEAVTLDGDGWSVVGQDPDVAADWQPDAILLNTPSGQRTALPRVFWSADDEPGAQHATIPVVMDRVAGDPDRARLELDLERARGAAARPRLVAQLEELADGAGPDADPVVNAANDAGTPAGQEG